MPVVALARSQVIRMPTTVGTTPTPISAQGKASLCAAWNCSRQAFSDLFGTKGSIGNFGRARELPEARQWWMDRGCTTDPADRRPVLELLVYETDGCIEPREAGWFYNIPAHSDASNGSRTHMWRLALNGTPLANPAIYLN